MNHRDITYVIFLILLTLAGPVLAGIVVQDDNGNDEQESRQGSILIAEPTSGIAGSAVQLQGSGFINNCGVGIYLNTLDGEPLGFATMRKDGGFVTQVTIPSETQPGKYMLIAQGLAEGAKPSHETQLCGEPSSDVARAGYDVGPAPPILEVSAYEGRPGRTVTFKGRGFCAATRCSPVDILIDGLVVAFDVPVNPDGTLSAEGMVPAVSASGEVRIEAIQQGSTGEQIRSFGSLIVTVRPNVRTGPN